MKKLSILTSLMISGLLFSTYSYGGEESCNASNYKSYTTPDPETGLNANTTKVIEERKKLGLTPVVCDFSDITMDSVDFDFKNADLRYSQFSSCNLSNIDFSGANMSNATVNGCFLFGDIKFHDTNMRGSNWGESKLDFLDFANADATDAVFMSSSLQATDMSKVIYDPKSESASLSFALAGYNSQTKFPKDAVLHKEYMVNCDEQPAHVTCGGQVELGVTEELLGIQYDAKGVTFQVYSSGCTVKTHFELIMKETSPIVYTLKRVAHADFCNVWLPYGEKITYTYREMGLLEGSKFIVSNPLMKRAVIDVPVLHKEE